MPNLDLSLTRLGDEMHTKFRELSRTSMPTEAFWTEMARFTRARLLHAEAPIRPAASTEQPDV